MGSKPREDEIFRSRMTMNRCPNNLTYIGNRIYFPGFNQTLRGVNHPPSSKADIKVKVEQ